MSTELNDVHPDWISEEYARSLNPSRAAKRMRALEDENMALHRTIKDDLAKQRAMLDALAASLLDLKAALIGTDKPQILPDWNKWHN